jgi:hypothetical protein
MPFEPALLRRFIRENKVKLKSPLLGDSVKKRIAEENVTWFALLAEKGHAELNQQQKIAA